MFLYKSFGHERKTCRQPSEINAQTHDSTRQHVHTTPAAVQNCIQFPRRSNANCSQNHNFLGARAPSSAPTTESLLCVVRTCDSCAAGRLARRMGKRAQLSGFVRAAAKKTKTLWCGRLQFFSNLFVFLLRILFTILEVSRLYGFMTVFQCE